jgi:hypothetical protein
VGGCPPRKVAYISTSDGLKRIVGSGAMDRFAPLVLSALGLGVLIGVVFQYAFPETQIGAELGALFALAGLLLAFLLRMSWRALRGAHR